MDRGLFHKAISQSGGSRDGVLTGRPLSEDGIDTHYPVSAETAGINFARRHDIVGEDAAALEKLRALSAEEIVDNGQETAGPGGPITYSGPILDGRLVVETAQSAYEAGRQANVPLIIGANSADFVGFISADTKDELFSQFSHAEKAAEIYDPEGTTELATLLVMAGTDKVQAEPARFAARAFEDKGAPVYVYRFGYVPDAMSERWQNGAPHGSEIAYVFDTLNAWPGSTPSPEDEDVARALNSYWANFAKSGNPNGEGLPVWPQYQREREEILVIEADGEFIGREDPWKARLDVSERAADAQP
ncbi:carboxylesterase family protein [Aquisalinus luteolus]|uniref:Carboxylesterase type B domain-containing protein n=1 Tax=Aquisalinus luteolus TaxID=1566827 RepID=A0A8J3A143_9PROT|nr:carboxylesterase family protein [Aquisalinus luteolus]GGH94639.1 hypothetical protein GCM10011355_09300 [Aquisalinus luteolus]